jgi:hypothetical protein
LINEIHNKSTYRRIYNNLSTKFVNDYCEFRSDGLEVRQSLFEAKGRLKTHLTVELARNYKHAKTVMKAYQDLKTDTTLIKKAILCYQGIKRRG